MSRRCLRGTIARATIALILFSTLFSIIGTVPVSALVIPRDQTVWGAGFGMNTGVYDPWNQGTNQGWTTYLMYEPLFGTNVATGELIYWLGKNITWLDPATIQITLRSDLHWTSIGSNLATNTTPITTDDVIFSFRILQQMGQIGSLCDTAGHGRLGRNVTDAFEKVSSTVFKVHINNASFVGSNEVFRQLTYGWLIFPKVVWQDINATYCGTSLANLANYANDWQDTTNTPAKWRVASGMYLPYYHDGASTIAARNDNWWGKSDSDFGRLPAPKYFGYTSYATNDLALLAMESGDLDWDGNYLPGLTQVKASYPNIVTYFDDLPYFPDKSPVLLVPNYHNYPLNQTWLHKALMSVIDYAAMSAVSSGYLKTPNVMLIPADDAVARATFNETLAQLYNVTYDATGTAGKDILSTYCTYNAATGVWWTKQGVTAGDPIKHYPLAEWPGKGGDNHTAPWAILDFLGWTDVNAIDIVAAGAFSTRLNIQTQVELLSGWGTLQERMNNFQYDFADMVMSGQINMNMYERYFQMFSPLSASAGGGVNAPLGGWYNETFVSDLEELDTKAAGSVAQWAVADELQEILGQVMPVIPLAGHADWQTYSDMYWTNWPHSVNNPMLPASPFAGPTQNANILTIIFGLKVRETTPPATITDLATGNPTTTNITLTWTAPGDNGTIGTAAGYLVKYSTLGPINASNWSSAATYSQSWMPLLAGSTESYVVNGLGGDTKYWFAVRAFDEVRNYGGVSNSPSGKTSDLVPPAPINVLAIGNVTQTSLTLTWTAPGDNGMQGTAAGYIVKYSTTGPITEANWNSATTYTQSWTPIQAGSTESHLITGLTPATTYWFAIKTFDEVPNYSDLSNSPSETTSAQSGGEALLLILVLVGVAAVAATVVIEVFVVRKRRS